MGFGKQAEKCFLARSQWAKCEDKSAGSRARAHGMRRAEDEDVSEIPSALWGRFLVRGFALGLCSLDPDPRFCVFLPTFENRASAVCAGDGVRLAAARAPEEVNFAAVVLYWIYWG